MRTAAVLTLVPLCLVLGQETKTSADKQETWSGVLVDSRCKPAKADPGSLMNRGTPPDSGRTWNGTDPNTSGTVDHSGSTRVKDDWDRSCYISAGTTAYSLKLQDGRTVKLDDTGNSLARTELKSRGGASKRERILRAKVTGTMDVDTLRVKDLQLK